MGHTGTGSLSPWTAWWSTINSSMQKQSPLALCSREGFAVQFVGLAPAMHLFLELTGFRFSASHPGKAGTKTTGGQELLLSPCFSSPVEPSARMHTYQLEWECIRP